MDWYVASAIATIAAAATTGFLAVVTWVQGKQLAYKDFVAHFNEMSSRIFVPMRRRLAARTKPADLLLGVPEGKYLGGGPSSGWWPELKDQEPGLVHHLSPTLRQSLDDLELEARRCDELHRPTFLAACQFFARECEAERIRLGLSVDPMPTLDLQPSGGDGVGVEQLWARSETMEQCLERRAAEQGWGTGKRPDVRILLGGHVLAQNDAAYRIINRTVSAMETDAILIQTKAQAERTVQQVGAASALLEEEAAQTPRRHWLWPRLARP